MWGDFLVELRKRNVVNRFCKVFSDFWNQEQFYVAMTADEKLLVVVEMLDPAAHTGIKNKFGPFFEGYEIILKKTPRGYLKYAKKKNLLP